jgi:predicted nucleic acid-binding protein
MRFPKKQTIATDIVRRGILENSVRVPHQAIVEFIAVVTRPIRGHVILPLAPIPLREAEEFLLQFTVLYPNEAIVRNAIRGCAAYQLSWFDAHLWSYAEHYGLSKIITEALQHERLYGTVRAVNPFGAKGKRGESPSNALPESIRTKRCSRSCCLHVGGVRSETAGTSATYTRTKGLKLTKRRSVLDATWAYSSAYPASRDARAASTCSKCGACTDWTG